MLTLNAFTMKSILQHDLLERLRAGEEDAFVALIDQYGASMLHLARRYVKDQAGAEEVVQDTWLAVLGGLERFEGRSNVKSWIFAILINKAMTRGKSDSRMLPFSSLAQSELAQHEPSVEPERFAGPQAEWPRHWASPLAAWSQTPEEQLLAGETQAMFLAALAGLPATQRAVVELRDIAGQEAASVAMVLGISEANVRVLLHRGRSKLRRALENYLTINTPDATGLSFLSKNAAVADANSGYAENDLCCANATVWRAKLWTLIVKISSKSLRNILKVNFLRMNGSDLKNIFWNVTIA